MASCTFLSHTLAVAQSPLPTTPACKQCCYHVSPEAGFPTSRITASLKLEKTSTITQTDQQPTPPMPTDHVPQSHISMVLQHLHRQRLHHLPAQPVPKHHC